MTLYMKCTTDRYEFPIAVADSGQELAKKLNMSVNSVWTCISKHRSGYHKIVVEDDQEEQ